MAEHDLQELELKAGDHSVRLVKAGHQPHASRSPVSSVPSETANSGAVAPPEGHLVTAPMVGTFYRTPAPGAPPFVEPGDPVKAGDVLCIIESMKMMNEITADRKGRIQTILVDHESPVDYGTPLFVIN